MTKEELYLKTIFCCIACDGDIATEEVDMVKDLCAKDNIFHDVDSEKYLNSWITEINEQGGVFLQTYLKEISSVELNEQEELLLVSLAIKAIKFFKKIRSRLTISDEAILAEHPNKEDFLLPDINITEPPQWDDSTFFSQISFPVQPN